MRPNKARHVFMRGPAPSNRMRWLATRFAALLAVMGAWPTPGLLWNSEPGNRSGRETIAGKAPLMKAGAGATFGSLASISLGVFAIATALYGMAHDPIGTALYNRVHLNVGDTGPLILTGAVAATGLVCASVGLRGRQRWLAITGMSVNAGGLVLAFLVKLAVEHGFGA